MKRKVSEKELKKLDQYIIDSYSEENRIDNAKRIMLDKDIYWAEGYLCSVNTSPKIMSEEDLWITAIYEDLITDEEDFLFYPIITVALREKQTSIATDDSQDFNIGELESFITNSVKELFINSDELRVNEMKKFMSNLSQEEIMDFMSDFNKKDMMRFMERVLGDNDLENEENNKVDYPQKTVLNDNKIGRNDPCFCGSGKKYKKYCLAN